MSKRTFYIIEGGDPSVGIAPSDSKVFFETDFNLKEREIKMIKDFLLELDDNGARVITDEELVEEQKAEQEHHLQQIIEHIRDQYQELSEDEFYELIKKHIRGNKNE